MLMSSAARAALNLSKPKSTHAFVLRCFCALFSHQQRINKNTQKHSHHLSSMLVSQSILHTFSTDAPSRNAQKNYQQRHNGDSSNDELEDEEMMVEWEEEEDDGESTIGDGGDGGGVVLGDVAWGELALSVAREILSKHFDEDLVMFAFKVSPRGYVYVRLDKLANKYGCPDIEEMKSFNSLYKQRLDDIVESGLIPIDLAVEVSSPGAERLLRVPDDLDRFKDMAMKVEYIDDLEFKTHPKKDTIFMIESIDAENNQCVWKLADVKENRAQAGKGRPLNRKQRDWRLILPFEAIKKVTLHLN